MHRCRRCHYALACRMNEQARRSIGGIDDDATPDPGRDHDRRRRGDRPARFGGGRPGHRVGARRRRRARLRADAQRAGSRCAPRHRGGRGGGSRTSVSRSAPEPSCRIDAARRAIDAGATFLVMPHLDAGDRRAGPPRRGIPAFPGCATPTEILAAWRAGAAAVKALPGLLARAGASSASCAGRSRTSRCCPTGGVTARDRRRVHRGRGDRRRDGWLAARRRRSGRRPGARRPDRRRGRGGPRRRGRS